MGIAASAGPPPGLLLFVRCHVFRFACPVCPLSCGVPKCAPVLVCFWKRCGDLIAGIDFLGVIGVPFRLLPHSFLWYGGIGVSTKNVQLLLIFR